MPKNMRIDPNDNGLSLEATGVIYIQRGNGRGCSEDHVPFLIVNRPFCFNGSRDVVGSA